MTESGLKAARCYRRKRELPYIYKTLLRAFEAVSRAQALNALVQTWLLFDKNDPEYLAPVTIAEVVRPLLELPPHERSMAEV
jgi:hypothetical protein